MMRNYLAVLSPGKRLSDPLKVALRSFSQLEYAMPIPNPPPIIIGHFLRLKNNRENTDPSTKPPPRKRLRTFLG